MLKQPGFWQEHPWAVLEEYSQSGHTFKSGYSQKTGAHFLTLTEGGETWDKAISLSCFHAEMEMTFRMMALALETQYNSFPSMAVDEALYDNNW